MRTPRVKKAEDLRVGVRYSRADFRLERRDGMVLLLLLSVYGNCCCCHVVCSPLNSSMYFVFNHMIVASCDSCDVISFFGFSDPE